MFRKLQRERERMFRKLQHEAKRVFRNLMILLFSSDFIIIKPQAFLLVVLPSVHFLQNKEALFFIFLKVSVKRLVCFIY